MYSSRMHMQTPEARADPTHLISFLCRPFRGPTVWTSRLLYTT